MLLRTLITVGALSLTCCAARATPEPIGLAELYWLLDRACVEGDELSVRMLLKAGADPTGIQGFEAFHKSAYQTAPFEPSWPINQAAYSGHTGVMRLLLAAGAKTDASEGEGQTALMLAASQGHIDAVRLLLEAGADKAYRAGPGSFEGSAADVAERAGHREISELIRGFHGSK